MKRPHFLITPLMFSVLLSASAVGAAPRTVTVLPFAAKTGEHQTWLSKGLSDLLIRHLAEAPSIVVLEREQLQTFLKEMDLGQAPLFDQAQALRVGRVAHVQDVVYGSYELDGSQLHLTAFLLDLDHQKVLSTAEARGPLKNIVRLARDLTQQLLEKRGTLLTSADRKRLEIKITDSVPALEHFYRGIDAYDHGVYADAWGEFFAATQQDADYLDARLWTGRMYEAKGDPQHAVIAYKELSTRAPSTVQAFDARLWMGRLLKDQLNDPDGALAQFKTLTQIAPDSPEGLEAAYQLGQLLEAKHDLVGAYHAYRFIEKFQLRVQTDPDETYQTRYAKSPFFSWDHALGLYPDALTHAILLYAQLIGHPDAKTIEAPRGVFVLDPARPVVGELFGKTPSFFKNRAANPKWREETYAVILPPGYVATGATMEITGRLLVQHTDRDYTMRLYPFPMPRDPQQGWIGVLYGQTPSVQTLRKAVNFHGENRQVFTLQLFTNEGEIQHWKLETRMKPVQDVGKLFADKPAHGAGFWEGQIMGDIDLPADSRTGSTRDLTQAFYQPQRDMALATDRSGRLTLITTVGEMDSPDVDLWIAHQLSSGPWTALNPLPINSQSIDWSPRLFRGEDGLLRLGWISNRRGLGWELWMSQADAQGQWSPAWRVPLEKFGAPETQASNDVQKPLDFDLFQDRRGRWMIPYYSAALNRVIILTSRNLQTWSVFASLNIEGPLYGLRLTQDQTERFVLAGWATSGRLQVQISNDGKRWTEQPVDYNTRYAPGHRIEIIPGTDGRLMWLTAGKADGPRVGWWTLSNQIDNQTKPVVRAKLENVTSSALAEGYYAVALREQDRIRVRKYREFVPSAGSRPSEYEGFVQREIEDDAEGNTWIRAFPGAKFIVPDVTAVGVEPARRGKSDPRVWFGIESGIFFHQGRDFQKTDVTQGFFHHFVTDIQSCAGLPVYFASRERPGPLLGIAEESGMGHRFSAAPIPGAHGAITGMACGEKPRTIHVETSMAETWQGDGTSWVRVGRDQSPSARRRDLLRLIKNPIYKSIGTVVKDPIKGFWYLPADDTFSKGVVYFDGQTHKIYNPPHDILQKPSSLAVDSQGGVWIGTWFNGLYKLERKK